MTNYILIALLTATVCIAATFFYQKLQHRLKRTKRPFFILPIDQGHLGYYYENFSTNTGIFSKQLGAWFQLQGTETNLTTLSQFFDRAELAKLTLLLQQLQEEAANIVPVEYSQACQATWQSSAISQVQITSNNQKNFECEGALATDQAGNITGVILWFRDISEERQSVNKLVQENERLKGKVYKFKNLLNALPFPIWERDKNLNINYFNYSYGQLIASGDNQAFSSDMLELDKQSKQLAKQAQDSLLPQNVNRHIVVNGQRFLYSFTETPIADDSNLIGCGQDITQQGKLKKELDLHISAHSDLLASSASAMAIYGADTKLHFFNQAFVKLWGLDERWLATQPTYGQILEQLREQRKLPEQANFPAFKQRNLKLFTELVEIHNEFFYLPDGTALRVIVIPHALGGLLFAYEDMTSKLALERSYNTLIAVQKATLDNLQEGIVVFGADGRLKLNNPIYAKLWNLDFEFLQSSPHMLDIFAKTSNCFLSEELEWLKQQFIETLNNRQISNYQLELVSGRVFSCMAIPLPDGATLITYCDVTDSTLVERSLRELNKALQDADRIKTEFLANVSYELRSPLTSIMGFSEALGQEYFGELNQHQKEYVEGIFNSSQYLMSLINDILDLASIEAGYMKLDVSRFDVRNAAIAVLSLVQERIKEAKLQLQFECQPNIGTMIGDEKRIKQVVFKLLSNAIKFNRSGGNIILTLNEIMPDNIIITIEDTGIGIDIEEQESVFNKFYQNQHNKQSGRSGAGLGLSFVKSFIELHGGTISIESSKNVYTKVCCILPRENPALLTDYKDNKQDDSRMKTTIPLTA